MPPGPAWGEERAGGRGGRASVGPPAPNQPVLPLPAAPLAGPLLWTGARLPFPGLSDHKLQPGPGRPDPGAGRHTSPREGWGRGDRPFGLTGLLVLGPAHRSGGPQVSWGQPDSGDPSTLRASPADRMWAEQEGGMLACEVSLKVKSEILYDFSSFCEPFCPNDILPRGKASPPFYRPED